MKDIEHGMAVKCSNKEQGDAVIEQLKKQGVKWAKCGSEHYTERDNICFVAFGEYSFYHAYISNARFKDFI